MTYQTSSHLEYFFCKTCDLLYSPCDSDLFKCEDNKLFSCVKNYMKNNMLSSRLKRSLSRGLHNKSHILQKKYYKCEMVWIIMFSCTSSPCISLV